MGDLDPYWVGQSGYGVSSAGIQWPIRSDASETFEFTWAQDSGAPVEAHGFTWPDLQVWVDETHIWLYANEAKRDGKMATLKQTKIDYAKQYLYSAKLTAEELLTAVREILASQNVAATVTPFAPKWRAGDVVTVKFGCTPYTYVRGRNNWPGDSAPLTDAAVSGHFIAGNVKPLLQQGGVPFDQSRLVAE